MRVAELRDLLATLPDGLLVEIDGMHVWSIRKASERTYPAIRSHDAACPDCKGTHRCWSGTRVTAPARLALSAGPRYSGGDIVDPERPVTYYGPWSRATKAVIDRYSADPDA